jgi:hypothetical protein
LVWLWTANLLMSNTVTGSGLLFWKCLLKWLIQVVKHENNKSKPALHKGCFPFPVTWAICS